MASLIHSKTFQEQVEKAHTCCVCGKNYFRDCVAITYHENKTYCLKCRGE